jgi:putative endonuclease
MAWQLYILFSRKLNRFYTGCTINLEERLQKHNDGFYSKSSFTTKVQDWELFLHFECKNEKQAKAVEQHIKKMKSKTYIQNLKTYPEMVDKLLSKYSL